ncbi:hypothetical protein BTA51_02425 [Hahella sp. CCB-MM4]|uniref:hypothetical protein n=1 Tax=Hahella sp. (strain CCB-MM4) TaxID=1926491 RepID=UPI000B9C0A56|nr:hypothetical protein [Hahella sp. CCB-MM4]OZG75260.1 hypothetical protein BTA51_02425 [Hahella sp. CCB-MM4]
MQRNKWFPLKDNDDIWIGQYIVPNFASNSVALRFAVDDWLIYSPGEPLLADWQAHWPEYQGRLSIVMPNAYHYLGVHAWQKAYPQAYLYASEKAAKRLRKKGLADIRLLEKQSPELPAEYRFLFPPGHRGGDIWISKKAAKGAIWITCDSFMNYPRLSNQPIARMLQRMLGTAPGIRIGEVIRWFILDNRTAFKHWALTQLQADQPQTLIPSHGEVFMGPQLSAELQLLVQQRL